VADVKLGKLLYKNVEIIFTSSTITGAPRVIRHEHINSDSQQLEILGHKPDSVQISGYVALIGDEENYIVKRDAILATLRTGKGTLVHPLHGIIDNAIATSWTLNEANSSIGIGELNITFEIDNTIYGPVLDSISLGSTSVGNDNVMSSADSELTKELVSSNKYIGVYSGIKNKLTNFGDAISSSIKFAVKASDDVANVITKPTDKLSMTIADFQNSIASLAASPQNIGASIVNVFETVNATIATASAAVEVYHSFFGFGWADDIELRFNTYANSIKNNNDRILNDSINIMALSNAYYFAVQKDYRTVDEIDSEVLVLENQFNSIFNRPKVNQKLLTDLFDVRQSANQLFASLRLNASSIMDVNIGIATSRALSYQYYGSDELANTIARLNMSNGLIMKDSVKILSA
jgi:DNA circularisation protein N-terminus